MASSDSEVILSVQELAKDPYVAVPERYLHDHQEPPTLNHSLQLPIIDMNQLSFSSGKAADFELQKLHSACKEWGFFQLVNHGISSSLMAELKSETEGFFNLPLKEKLKYKAKPGDFEGFGTGSRNAEKSDWGDRVLLTINPVHKRNPHLFPEFPSSLRDTLESYISEVQKLGMKILGLMGKALGMEENEMHKVFDDGMQLMRMNYYPPFPQPELVVGLTSHSDGGGLTILNQVNGVNGLQIRRDDAWLPVNFLSDALVVNVGDILEILTNGVYKSIEHRATINSMGERISLAIFMNPKLEAEVGPSASLINSANPPLFQRVGMEDYLKSFFSRKLDKKTNVERMRLSN